MTKIQIDFEFEFVRDAQTHQVIVDLESPSTNDEDQQAIKQIIDEADIDLTDEEALEELGWEIDEYLQYDIIYPKLKISNIVLLEQDNKVTFDLTLNLWGKIFSTTDTLTDAKYFEIDADTSVDEVEAIIMRNYYGTHHNFDITELKLTVLP